MYILLNAVFIVVDICVLAIVYWALASFKYALSVRADEIHTVTTKDGWRVKLLRYRPEQPGGEPVFLCHGLFGNHVNFDAPEGVSLTDVLVEMGYDCWVVDLRGCKSCIPPVGRTRYDAELDDILRFDLPACIEHIRRATGFDKVHWIGLSMGGMLLYAYNMAYGSGQIASATTLGGPPGFAGVNLGSLTVPRWLARNFPGLSSKAIRSTAPVARTLGSLSAHGPINWNNMHHQVGPEVLFNMLEDLTPKISEKMADAVLTNRLVLKTDTKGSIDYVDGLKRLDLPLFAIFGFQDIFISVDTARKFFAELPGSDKKLLILSRGNGHANDYNHEDLVFGVQGRKEVFEPIAEWLKAHSMAAKETEAPSGKKKTSVPKATRAKAVRPPERTASAKKKPAVEEKAAAKKKPNLSAKRVSLKQKAAPRKTASKKTVRAKTP